MAPEAHGSLRNSKNKPNLRNCPYYYGGIHDYGDIYTLS